jgi:hypothetical protein
MRSKVEEQCRLQASGYRLQIPTGVCIERSRAYYTEVRERDVKMDGKKLCHASYLDYM